MWKAMTNQFPMSTIFPTWCPLQTHYFVQYRIEVQQKQQQHCCSKNRKMAPHVRVSGTRKRDDRSALTRMVDGVFTFVRYAEFEILFLLFFFIAFLVFKHLTSRPENSQILVRRPGDF